MKKTNLHAQKAPILAAAMLAAGVGAADEALAASGDAAKAGVQVEAFGTMPDGAKVQRFTLRNTKGMVVKLINLGAIITEIRVLDREGKMANVVLGSDKLEAYVKGHPAAAAVIGRYANRIANARFSLDGVEYKLAANSGQHHIHGGPNNFARAIWTGKALKDAAEPAVEFTYFSKDGEEGYPGNMEVSVRYFLTERNELRVEYRAKTDKATVVNLTNHAYFNLAGKGDALGHELWISATEYTLADDKLIPTGAFASVHGTALDFTTPAPLGARIDQLKPRMTGYDHNYVLRRDDNPPKEPQLFARACDPESGRTMEVLTTEPGVMLYTGNHIRSFTGTDGAEFGKHAGFCLETQHYPDSPNKPAFPSTVLRPDQSFESVTVFRFGVKG